VGVIHAQHLYGQQWWKTNQISLSVMPEPFIENVEIKKIKKRSLELAGIKI
jgi:homoserine dehydrogenase